jgi:hypothetical protein
MMALRSANLLLAALATLAPTAHVLELPNKLALDGPLWVAVQQQLYRGWGPFLGGPVEISAFTMTVVLLIARRSDRATRLPRLVAAIAYAGMLVTFFIFNDPVNAAVNGWIPASLPADWRSYRLQWETGHALAALLSVIALVAIFRAWLIEHDASVANKRNLR